MAPEPRTQEQSIKARKRDLFEDDPVLDAGPRRSFQDCLKETPGEPLPAWIKAGLWTLGTIVILLLVAALATMGTKKPKASHSRTLSPIAAPRNG